MSASAMLCCAVPCSQSAVDAGAISARAKPAAAAEKAKELQGMLQQRGCKEEFVPDPDLLLNGQVGLVFLLILCWNVLNVLV